MARKRHAPGELAVAVHPNDRETRSRRLQALIGITAAIHREPVRCSVATATLSSTL
jgi:hypothetical protein